MAVLAEPAARVAPPSLEEMLDLADRLLALGGGRRMLNRKDQFTGRLCRLFEALARKRYGKYTRLESVREKAGRSQEGEAPLTPGPSPAEGPRGDRGERE
jgi:hypothetical protein